MKDEERKEGLQGSFRYVDESSPSPSEEGRERSWSGERIALFALHALTIVGGIVIAVLGGILSSASTLFRQWGVGGVLSIVLFGVVLALGGVANLLSALFDRLGKGRTFSLLRKALFSFALASLFTAFSILLLRPTAIESYLHSSHAFPYSTSSGYILIGISWVVAIGMVLAEFFLSSRKSAASQGVLSGLRLSLLSLVLYVPLAFYPLLTKSYVLSPSLPAIVLLVCSAVSLDLSALFLFLKGRKGAEAAFRFFALLAFLLFASMLLAYGLGFNRLSF